MRNVRFTDTSALPYCIPYIVPVVVILGQRYQFPLSHWVGIIFAFVFIPLIDAIVGLDHSNPTSKEQVKELEKKLSFRLVTWLWVPQQLALIVYAAYVLSLEPGRPGVPQTTFQLLGFVVSVGIATGGLGINIAHELIHKPGLFEQTLGRILLVSVSYGHFFVEHLRGHHKRVATDYDPATSRLGEGFHRFWPRTVVGSFKSAWHLEEARIALAARRKGRAPPTGFAALMRNQVFWMCLCSLGCAIALGVAFGEQAFWFFWAQSVVAFTLLELVNYIEHYGLVRKFVQVTPMHSWNAGYRISNYFLFKLQRHSDHHANAGRRYQVLRSWENSPQMPAGYPAMIILALFPPLWHYVMDKRVLAYRKKAEEFEKSGINMFPDPTLNQVEDDWTAADDQGSTSDSDSNASKKAL